MSNSIWHNWRVQIVLTAKLKLLHTPEQKIALDGVTLAYRDGLNFASRAAYELGKTSSAPKIHKEVYCKIREQFGLKSQMACTVSREVGSKYKAQWTKQKNHAAQQARNVTAGRKTRRFKGFDAPPKFVSRSLMMFYKKDYSFKKGQQVSVDTLGDRLVLPYVGYQKHLDLITQGAEIGSGTLWYDKRKKQYYLLVALTVTLPDPQPQDHKSVVGVDVGQRYHLVATDNQHQTHFESGRAINFKKDQYARVRKSLQRKDTRSATRRLVLLSGRERRFIADRNHSLASKLLNRFPHSIIGLEDLTHIRERTERRSSPKDSPKMKSSKRRRSQWSFAELQTFIAHKAPLRGSMAVKVHAEYTSQCCPRCGHSDKENRPNKGLEFICVVCGYRKHADLVASENINLRTLLVRQDWMSTGVLSVRPDASYSESKAVYSELRWSTDASLRIHP